MILFAFFGVWEVAIAAGAGGAAMAIPVIIHLINRKRFKIVLWAAMKFLLAAQKQTRKRMRIEQLLLLLVRMLIVALIAFAMICVMDDAEAFWARMGFASIGHSKRKERIHHVFVLDASLSMNQTAEGGQPAFDKARQQVLKKMQDNPSGDAYSVLLLKDSPTWLVGEASQDYRRVMREIEAVKPSHGNSSLGPALGMIAAKLTEAKQRFPNQAVYFFTDLQAATWLGAATSDLAPGPEGNQKHPYLDIEANATTVLVDVGQDGVSNLAVTDIAFRTAFVTTGTDPQIVAAVQNYSDQAKKGVRVELLVGKAKEHANHAALQLRVVDEDVVDFIAKERQEILFKKGYRFPEPGTYVVQVRVGDDALMADNLRSIVITVRETIPVLLVNGKASADRFLRATEYARLALQPFPAGAEPKMFPLRPKVVMPSQFKDMTEADLEQYDCVFWCDVGEFGEKEVRKIDTHLRRGGGFIVSMGDMAAEKIEQYNKLLFKEEQGILPAKFVPYKNANKVVAPLEHHFYFQNTDPNAFSQPPLKEFSDDQDRLSLRMPRFRQFVLSTVPEGRARTILSFMPEATNTEKVKRDDTLPVSAPAIVEWNPPLARAQQPLGNPGAKGAKVERQPARYRGKVILLTSSLNMDWSTWPGSPSFGALLNELTILGVTGRLREKAQNVGGMLEEFLAGSNEIDVTVHYPQSATHAKPKSIKTQPLDEVNLFRWHDTDFAGIYRVEAAGGLEFPFAVNPPVATLDQKGTESDLSRVDENKLRSLYVGWDLKVVPDARLAEIRLGDSNANPIEIHQPVGPTYANVALLLALGLMFSEIVLAWLFGHYTTTEGALTGAAPGATHTAVAAVIAVLSTILFAIGGSVIFHEKMTGDFLGFLPDILRTYFENLVGAPPLLPGEGSNWEFETNSFLFGLPRESWWAVAFALGAVVTIFVTYRAEAPRVSVVYKLLLGALRLYLILMTLWFLLPRPQLQYARLGYPDMVLLIDDTRSMGEADSFQDQKVIERVNKLSESIRETLVKELPDKIAKMEADEAAKVGPAAGDPEVKAELDVLRQRLSYWKRQHENIKNDKWRPSRLQLVQAILAQPAPHWLKTLLTTHRTKVHIFHLDINGRAAKLRDKDFDVGELVDPAKIGQIDSALKAIAELEPVGTDSRLGTAVRQVIDHYNGSALSSVIMFTDGVTTRDETILQASEYAAQKGVALFFVGVGDEQKLKDLKLHDLDVEDTIYIGDRAVFEAGVTGEGFKDLTVRVVLKLIDKAGKEKIVDSVMQKVDPAGRTMKIKLRDEPKQVGSHKYVIEIEPPKLEKNEKPFPPSNLRIERTIEVVDAKLIKVLYVEGQPRYEFRYIKFLLEREGPEAKNKKKTIDLKVLLLDADDDFATQDKAALKNFPPTLEALNQYDVLIIGDCDPNHKKLQNRLKDIASFVRGEDEKGKKSAKSGGGLLFMAGALNNPHRYRATPLADVIPVLPLRDAPPQEVAKVDQMRPDLTSVGRSHPIFRFSPNEEENRRIWSQLTPMYWNSTEYQMHRHAQVLAVHPRDKGTTKDATGEDRHPLVVEQFVGTGRCMFFGFDETWRWRLREHESKFNNFWIQTMRYLSRGRKERTDLRLDRQTPYRVGEPIKVQVRFPDSTQGGGGPDGIKLDAKTEVKVMVKYAPPDAKEQGVETQPIAMRKVEGSWGTYEGEVTRTREGKYDIWLSSPDVSATQPDKAKPSAQATVLLPPGELDKLRLNQQELVQSADSTAGRFYTLAKANDVLDELPPAGRPVLSAQVPPTLLWNQWWVFAVVVFLLTSEWVLRKWKHLL